MHFLQTIAAVTVLAITGTIAAPPLPPTPANDNLRTITNDLAVLEGAAAMSGKEIQSLLATIKGATDDSVIATANVQINSHLAAIEAAAMNSAWGVEGDVADSAKTVSASEAAALKSDAQYLAGIAKDIAVTMKKLAMAKASETNADLKARKDAIAAALQAVARPLASYIKSVKASGERGSFEADLDLKASAAGLVGMIKTSFGGIKIGQ